MPKTESTPKIAPSLSLSIFEKGDRVLITDGYYDGKYGKVQ